MYGNLSLGGTGKTPLVKFLIERLSEKINISVLSRGYKRKTKGFIEVSDESDVNDVGDENFMIKKSFKKIMFLLVKIDYMQWIKFQNLVMLI